MSKNLQKVQDMLDGKGMGKIQVGFTEEAEKIRKDKKIKDGIKALNNSWSKIEDNLKEKGVEVKFEKFKLSDFI